MPTPHPQSLLKLSLIISFLGILLLLFLSSKEPQLTTINNTIKLEEGKLIKLQGNITFSDEKENFFILTLEDKTGKMNIISEKNFSNQIEVLGKTEIYRNKTQIRAERIIEK